MPSSFQKAKTRKSPGAQVGRSSSRLRPTTLDYLLQALSPALIIGMIACLVFFLLTLVYEGDFTIRLMYILGLFTFASVLIARIAIEQNRALSMVYLIVMGCSAMLVIMRFIQFPPGLQLLAFPIVLGFLVLIAVLADRITYDCTVIDDQEDSSGEGLLQSLGLQKSQLRSGANKKSVQAGQDKPAKESTSVSSKKRRKHNPGVWVLYFALLAIPLFGFGQLFMTGSAAARDRSFIFLFGYLLCALSLLVVTSFLNVRRYLRQRNVAMPADMTATWLSSGIVGVIVLLVAAMILPLPGREFGLFGMPFKLTSGDMKSSKWGWGPEGVRDNSNNNAVPNPQGSESSNASNDSSKSERPKVAGGASESQNQSSSDGKQNASQSKSSSPDGSVNELKGSSSDSGNSGNSPRSQQNANSPESRDGQSKGGQSKGDNGQQSPSSESQGKGQSKGQSPGSEPSSSERSKQSNQARDTNESGSRESQSSQQKDTGGSQSEQKSGNQQKNSSQQKDNTQQSSQQQKNSSQSDSNKQESSSAKQQDQQQSNQQRSDQQNTKQQDNRSNEDASAKQQDAGSKSDSNKQSANRNKSENKPNQKQDDSSKQSNEQGKQNEAQRDQSKSESDQKREQQKSESPKDQSQQKDSAQQKNNATSQPQNSGNWLSNIFKALPNLATIIKIITALILVAIIVYYLLRHGHELLAAFRDWFDRLFGKQANEAMQASSKPEATDSTVLNVPKFSSFANPFSKKLTEGSQAEVVRYTFDAVQAWAVEQGVPRQEEETPEEYLRRLSRQFPNQATQLQSLSGLYYKLAYANRQIKITDIEPLRILCNWLWSPKVPA